MLEVTQYIFYRKEAYKTLEYKTQEYKTLHPEIR